MIKVTSTLIIHRPERVLYYLPEVTEEIKQNIADGLVPPLLENCLGAFGTYDKVGEFYFSADLRKKTGKKQVVGIEYRKDDDSLDLPKHLPSVILPACDIIVQDIAYDTQLSDEVRDEIICYARNTENVRSGQYRYVDDGLISVFLNKNKLRIMYEIELKNAVDTYFSGNFEDWTKEKLYKRAYHDAITGYYNWNWMWDCLSSYYMQGISDYGFVHFDVKDFKMVNEIYNHEVANQLLRRITQNMEAHSDWIYFGARCDNDNFSMMIHDMPEEETREKLSAFFDELSRLEEDPSYQIYYRCGVVGMRNAMNTGDIVADCAKLAQGMGKKINVTEIHFYTDEIHENAILGKQLKAYLDTAIRLDEFVVYLQPKMNIENESVCGAEALIRWDYMHKGLLPPNRFIPHFETDHSIIKIDELVLHHVCAKLKEWKKKGYELHPISVNLSRKHMEQIDLADHLTSIVDLYEIDHNLIEFELTESSMFENQKYMVSILHELKRNGFLISMDDFGTGYSSFGLLKDMPLDTLKIDKSFVDFVAVNEDADKNRIILRHIISMAKDLGIHCIAEGAEEYEQVTALRELGCEAVQGYYYSKPISMDSFEEKYMLPIDGQPK